MKDDNLCVFQQNFLMDIWDHQALIRYIEMVKEESLLLI